jgi:hypothetical protein
MTWKRHFQLVPTRKLQAPAAGSDGGGVAASAGKYASWLPEVYSGQPNRVERYNQYNQMDLDTEISTALDVIADFCTQTEETKDLPFQIDYHDDVTEIEVNLLETALRQWCKLNSFKRNIWRTFRNVLKYGDQFYIRDPETFEWLWVDQTKVTTIVVNESEGKKPEQYLIRDLNINLQSKVATQPRNGTSAGHTPSAWPTHGEQPGGSGGMPSTAGRFSSDQATIAVDAEHIVHLSLSEGMDGNWPFGNSVLESVFKTFKQKELLEDALIIYRVQRAPERRVFYIDVGSMPTHKAMAFVERVKMEIHQKRIPNRTGGGTSIMDASYNPMSIVEDYFFAQTSEGRGSKVETLPGGDSLGQIDDLLYFDNKLKRGLGVPASYLPSGSEDGSQSYSDGRVGTAYIQEYRFAKYCQRLQSLLEPVFDQEFKEYLKRKGITISKNLYTLEMCPPQNFSKFRQVEIDTAHINTFGQLVSVPWMSRRFLASRYLGWTEDEIIENESQWKEENPGRLKTKVGKTAADEVGGGLRDVGIGGGPDPFAGDLGPMSPEGPDADGMPDGGGDMGGAPPPGGGAPGGAPLGGSPPAGAPTAGLGL